MEVKKSAIISVLLILMLFSWSVSSVTHSEFGVTNVKVSKLTLQYTWMIHDYKLFASLDNSNFFFDSPDFRPSDNESFKWCLRIYPAKVNMGLYIVNKGYHAITVNYTLSIGSQKRNAQKALSPQGLGGWDPFIIRTEALNSCLPNGTLIIKCEINTLFEILTSSEINVDDQYMQIKNQANESKLPDELLTLLEDEKFSDISILIDDNAIRAHKAILALRSPVFASLLMKNGTTVSCDGNSSFIEIKDVRPKIFKKLLQYIYTDKVDGIDGAIAKELLVAAIKYDIKGLKVICEEILYNSINIDNDIEVFEIADQYHMPALKSRAIKFAGEHAIFLMHSCAFKTLEQSKPHLMRELLDAMIPRKSSAQTA